MKQKGRKAPNKPTIPKSHEKAIADVSKAMIGQLVDDPRSVEDLGAGVMVFCDIATAASIGVLDDLREGLDDLDPDAAQVITWYRDAGKLFGALRARAPAIAALRDTLDSGPPRGHFRALVINDDGVAACHPALPTPHFAEPVYIDPTWGAVHVAFVRSFQGTAARLFKGDDPDHVFIILDGSMGWGPRSLAIESLDVLMQSIAAMDDEDGFAKAVLPSVRKARAFLATLKPSEKLAYAVSMALGLVSIVPIPKSALIASNAVRAEMH